MSHCKESFSFVCKIHLELLNSLFNRIFSNWLTCQILDSVFSQPYNPGFCTRQYNQHLHCTESWILRFKNTLTLHPPLPPPPYTAKGKCLLTLMLPELFLRGGVMHTCLKNNFSTEDYLNPSKILWVFWKQRPLRIKWWFHTMLEQWFIKCKSSVNNICQSTFLGTQSEFSIQVYGKI